jgi:rhomboid protease GluP
MDLQLFLAINAMTVSAMVIGMLVIYRRLQGNAGWILANAIVLVVGALALWLRPADAGTWVALVFIPLIIAPVLFARLQQRSMMLGRNAAAARYAKCAAFFHPTEGNRINAAVAAAVAASSEVNTQPLRDLTRRVPTQYRPLVAVHEALVRRDWAEVLANADHADAVPALMRPMEIRALGELGRRTDMVRAYFNAKDHLAGATATVARMTVLAFAGRPNGVQAAVGTALSALQEENKTFWIAVAYLNGSADPAVGERVLTQLAATANLPVTRAAAKRHLAMAAAGPPERLPASMTQALDILEQQTLAQAEGRGPVYLAYPLTVGLIILNLLAFAAEVFTGGSENSDTLIKLGALTPPHVLEDGEWWRLVTASFLHFGPIHLVTNMFVLWVLGRLLEPLLGTARMLVIYAIGGVASSAFVLALMVANDTDYGLLVGASGAIFALLGAEAAMLLTEWWRNRAGFDTRKLSTLAMMLGLQIVIDLSLPQVSFAAHASGFVTGLLVMLALPSLAALFNAATSAIGRRS